MRERIIAVLLAAGVVVGATSMAACTETDAGATGSTTAASPAPFGSPSTAATLTPSGLPSVATTPTEQPPWVATGFGPGSLTPARPMPPGTRAFVRSRDVWLLEEGADGRGRLTRVTHDGQDVWIDGWFPDGGSVLVERDAKGQRDFVRVVLSEPRSEAILMRVEELWRFEPKGGALSPDGKSVLIWDPDVGALVSVTLANARRRVVVTRKPTVSESVHRSIPSAAWSPDGRRIAFVDLTGIEKMGTVARVVTSGADGTRARKLTSLLYWDPHDLAWSPDGRRVVYVSSFGRKGIGGLRGPGQGLWVMDVATGRSIRLTSARGIGAGVPAWSSDGRWIYRETNSGVIKVDAWSGAVVQVATFGT